MSQQIKNKWSTIKDIYLAINKEGLSVAYPNPALLLEKIIQDKDNNLLTRLKEHDSEAQIKESLAVYKKNRKKEYLSEGINIERMIIALWESIVENDNTLLSEIQLKRESIKIKHKKPKNS